MGNGSNTPFNGQSWLARNITALEYSLSLKGYLNFEARATEAFFMWQSHGRLLLFCFLTFDWS